MIETKESKATCGLKRAETDGDGTRWKNDGGSVTAGF